MYDSGGNRTTQTNERGHTERFYYDAHNRLLSQWDLGDTLLTNYEYDNFYRLTQKRQTDLLSGRVRDVDLVYNHYDELIRLTDPLLHDAAGNRISETDARGNTEYFNYDGENRVIGRVDRAGQRWTTAYNGLGYKLLEIDGDGRTTRYDVGRFGQVHGMTVSGGDQSHRTGNNGHDEEYTLDWQGRQVAVSDNYGKEIVYTFDDAEVRNQRFSYNPRGWLSGADTQINYSDAGIGLSQAFHAVYHYDELGNRVQSNGQRYSYDANNRMTNAYDGRNERVINGIAYDGFGNRTRITHAAGAVTYSYDLNNRVLSSSAGDSWDYDDVGNATGHTKPGGAYTTREYDGANRTIRSFSHSLDNGDWSDVTTDIVYDGAGNVLNTQIRAQDYGFDELAYYDVRYNVQHKHISNSYVEGAKYLYGDASFSYNENGQLTYVDRGRQKGAQQNSQLQLR